VPVERDQFASIAAVTDEMDELLDRLSATVADLKAILAGVVATGCADRPRET
jgi:hypothetical protein